QPFLATIIALIDVSKGKFTLMLNEDEIKFNIYHTNKVFEDTNSLSWVKVIETLDDDVKVEERSCNEKTVVKHEFLPRQQVFSYDQG
ncbi:hypothetical protein PanWU01x14_366420, partial [Parasponia andersonii]